MSEVDLVRFMTGPSPLLAMGLREDASFAVTDGRREHYRALMCRGDTRGTRHLARQMDQWLGEHRRRLGHEAACNFMRIA